MNNTERVLHFFEQVSSIARGTKHEAQIRQWLLDWAGQARFTSDKDAAGNIVIRVPASAGRESAPTLVLQGHMDMVWQKTPESAHDFMRDPIRLIREGDWIHADGTTLGADNGAAIALMLALAEDESLTHPALELLLTVEEESGLVGANKMDAELITGKTLINLDSEDETVFTVGCAGGGRLLMDLPAQWEKISAGEEFFALKVRGLRGGHSGGDIEKHRGNANRILARALDELQRGAPIRLASFLGGTAANAIPRDADAIFACAKEQTAILRERFAAFQNILAVEHAFTEPGLLLSLEATSAPTRLLSEENTRRFVNLILSLPNGVEEFSAQVSGAVETSNNIGVVEMHDDFLRVISNQRSSVFSRLDEIFRRVESVAQLAGARTERVSMSEPWKPNLDSELLKKCMAVYEKQYGVKPKLEVTHGGLECGIISARCGGLDTLSLGPTIESPHSPDERMFVPSLGRTYDFLAGVLRALSLS